MAGTNQTRLYLCLLLHLLLHYSSPSSPSSPSFPSTVTGTVLIKTVLLHPLRCATSKSFVRVVLSSQFRIKKKNIEVTCPPTLTPQLPNLSNLLLQSNTLSRPVLIETRNSNDGDVDCSDDDDDDDDDFDDGGDDDVVSVDTKYLSTKKLPKVLPLAPNSISVLDALPLPLSPLETTTTTTTSTTTTTTT